MAQNKKQSANAKAAQAAVEQQKKVKPNNAKKAEEKKGKNGKTKKPGLFTCIKDYFKAVKSEMKRVVWPTKQELINASLIVIGALVFFGVFIAIIDNIVIVPLDALASLSK